MFGNRRDFRSIPLLFLAVGCVPPSRAEAPSHPRLVMTPAQVRAMRSEKGSLDIFLTTLAAAQREVDAEIAAGIDTPEPRDYSGGYTHQRHKRNYAVAHKAGALYQILGDEKYAAYVRDMLRQYAAMYGRLPLHPKTRSYARGKLFWQCLNDANWLVFMSQAYDAIYDFLAPEERERLERELFRPFADHLSVASPQFFNRIHNHSTWGTAAVGMIGLVMGDRALVQRALYGLDMDNSGEARDDDGGFIRAEGQKAGFFANLDSAFSPDGYYTEGPYYQRYAMYPFLVFAQSLRNARYPEQAFERNGGVLVKAVETLIQLSDKDGEFFPLNDAQKGMSLRADALVTAVDVGFAASRNRRLLSIAATQGRVLLDGAGFAVARALAQGEAEPFSKTSLEVRDGAKGDEGGLAVLRAEDEALTLVFKYSAQGLSHGHYDKLSFSLYREGTEVLQDYGMARFVNIGPKGGGNYLPENTTWSKQSIAHNTLVIDETSHFEGKYEIGSQHHSERGVFDIRDPSAQIVSARERHAYPGRTLRRTLALLELPGSAVPIVLDLLEAESGTTEESQYDVPFHYFGQIISTDLDFEQADRPEPLGDGHGYQHLFVEAKARVLAGGSRRFEWMHERKFYTLISATQAGDEVMLTRLGAGDPGFNLRR
ncbi:MAG: alginate lyase family protein, partial [Myxococcota bacterium]